MYSTARQIVRNERERKKKQLHTTPGIRWWSPTQLLVWRSLAYLWESGRDPELSRGFGRMCLEMVNLGTMISWAPLESPFSLFFLFFFLNAGRRIILIIT